MASRKRGDWRSKPFDLEAFEKKLKMKKTVHGAGPDRARAPLDPARFEVSAPWQPGVFAEVADLDALRTDARQPVVAAVRDLAAALTSDAYACEEGGRPVRVFTAPDSAWRPLLLGLMRWRGFLVDVPHDFLVAYDPDNAELARAIQAKAPEARVHHVVVPAFELDPARTSLDIALVTGAATGGFWGLGPRRDGRARATESPPARGKRPRSLTEYPGHLSNSDDLLYGGGLHQVVGKTEDDCLSSLILDCRFGTIERGSTDPDADPERRDLEGFFAQARTWWSARISGRAETWLFEIGRFEGGLVGTWTAAVWT